MDTDPFTANIAGVQNLIESPENKVASTFDHDEGAISDVIDLLELDKSDEELKELRRAYENKSAPYTGKIEPRQKQNKAYLFGTNRSTGGILSKTVPSNLLFQATATFVPQALAKNPEPVVWSDNTDEGKEASNDIKTMLQFHADILCLRKKLGLMVWQWSVDFIGIKKFGFNKKTNDISCEVRKPKNFIFDPDGYVDEYGDFQGEYLGERIKSTAQELVDLFPDSKELITQDVGEKMGTLVQRTEWWNDEFTFTTYKEEILDKSKNPFFNYDGRKNHFAIPKMPYNFLSVFSLQEQPHDFTNLIEQNQANQDAIIDDDIQVSKSLRHANNDIVLDPKYFDAETARVAAVALENGDPILGDPLGIKRLDAPALPSGLLESQDRKKETLLGVYGVNGVTAQSANEDTTARGMILNQSFDNTRIGGGVGDALEQVADNDFNWFVQLYYVFYDEKHYASIMGQDRAVKYVSLMMADQDRHFVVSVSPDSMSPKDEVSEQNQAIQLADSGWLDPISLFKKLNYADPMETAKAVTLFRINPQQYMQTYFPEVQQQPQVQGQGQPQQGGAQPNQPESPPQELSQEPANASLSSVKLPQ